MRPRRPLLLVLLAAVILGAATYAGYQAQARRAAVLDRIAALDACLAVGNQQQAQDAVATVNHIATAVSKNHNMANDVAVLKAAQLIQARSQSLADTLHLLRQQWQQPSTAAGLKQLPKQLDQYVGFVRQYDPEAFPMTQQFYMSLPTGWFGQFDITTEPKPAALAMLTKLETQLRQHEADALEKQAEKVGSGCDLCFDKIGVFALAASNTITPGAVYQAQLCLTLAAASNFRQHMSANGHPVYIDPRTNYGSVRFNIPAARLGQPDTVRATWQGAIQFRPNGNDTVMNVTVPYFIVKRPLP